ncbi:hypothetical protein F2Q68_00025477 [Brassica cretica]|uniref:Uncharacterized protein n=1 Tax=Brassica cretica TaxID=69181 RepID=A0A8S9IGA0_BRACR|nr:hypothetical protein F2Q68_00025477 [Brassica cretica]
MNPQNIPRDMFLGIYRGTRSSEFSEGPVPRNFPRDPFLGIFRGTRSSEFSEGSVPRKFLMKIPRNISSELPRIGPSESPSKYPEEVLPRYIPRSFPTNWWSSEFPRKFVSSEICFLRIPSENSKGFPKKIEFPRSYFRGLVSSEKFSSPGVATSAFPDDSQLDTPTINVQETIIPSLTVELNYGSTALEEHTINPCIESQHLRLDGFHRIIGTLYSKFRNTLSKTKDASQISLSELKPWRVHVVREPLSPSYSVFGKLEGEENW